MNNYNINEEQEVTIISFENFYKNPNEIRNYLLTKDFNYDVNECAYRSNIDISLSKIKPILQTIIGQEIVIKDYCFFNKFYNNLNKINLDVKNGNNNEWTAIIFLTPFASLSSGVSFYKLTEEENNSNFMIDNNIGNLFNRLVIFKSNMYNSIGYFGTNYSNGNLYQRILLSCN